MNQKKKVKRILQLYPSNTLAISVKRPIGVENSQSFQLIMQSRNALDPTEAVMIREREGGTWHSYAVTQKIQKHFPRLKIHICKKKEERRKKKKKEEERRKKRKENY